ncbi:hypothetical protein BDF22DRAFT_672595 [Syncephalis plumigaleata]|nr:hypothetical protein BDF22DRAFT_672595 [Syncephalis plumigaleata]
MDSTRAIPVCPVWEQRVSTAPKATLIPLDMNELEKHRKKKRKIDESSTDVFNSELARSDDQSIGLQFADQSDEAREIHRQNYSHLRQMIQKTPYKLIINELNILEKVHQRSWYQHRRAVYYRSIIRIRQLGKRLLALNYYNLLEELSTIMYRAKVKDNNTSSIQWQNVASREWMSWLTARCYGGIQLMDQMLVQLEEGYRQMRSLLAQTYFMPMALTMTAIIGRLWTLLRVERTELAQLYDKLHCWVPLFPWLCDDESETTNSWWSLLPVSVPPLSISSNSKGGDEYNRLVTEMEAIAQTSNTTNINNGIAKDQSTNTSSNVYCNNNNEDEYDLGEIITR